MSYLEEAAGQLRRARDANEARAAGPRPRSWLTEEDVPLLTEVNARRMEIAAAFTALAAIEAGLPPCYPVPQPDPQARSEP